MEHYKLLSYYNIKKDSTIHALGRLFRRLELHLLKCKWEDIDDRFYIDLTNIKDNGKVYKRGNEAYHRPYGWKRIALRVWNKAR